MNTTSAVVSTLNLVAKPSLESHNNKLTQDETDITKFNRCQFFTNCILLDGTHTNTLSINRSVASVAGGTIIKDTKTHAARHIAIDTDTMTALARQLERAKEHAIACEIEFDDNSFVFSSVPDGTQPLHPDSITTGFRRLCDKAGLKGVRLHDLRHLHATQLLAAGVPVRTVSGRLGHANAATTLNVYAHFLQASDRQAADVIEGLLAAPPASA